MNPLHKWDVSTEKAIRIQEILRDRIVLTNTFSRVSLIGGADAAYSKENNLIFGSIAILSYPDMNLIETVMAYGEVSFPYIPGLFSFREGPILIEAFQKLKIKPDVMIFEGHGIAHPKGFGLSSHLGLWIDLPSIGCAKTLLIGPSISQDFTPERSKGRFGWIRQEGKVVGASVRTKEGVKPIYVSPGHRIDLKTSIEIILASCTKFRLPEPLRKAHQASRLMRKKP
jgi:deoxyribonuclease V